LLILPGGRDYSNRWFSASMHSLGRDALGAAGSLRGKGRLSVRPRR